MAGNQVVPRLACPAFQEWSPREAAPFFTSVELGRHFRRSHKPRLNLIKINNRGLQDMIAIRRLFS